MKFLMANLMAFCMLIAKAQGPQQLVDVPYDSWPGATIKGWLYLPADYATSTKKYPVVFFYHGLGECGTNPYTLLNNGLPRLIAQGMRPDNVVNPADGQPYSFIVLSVQHWSWSPNPLWLPHELNWLKQNYRIDTNRVYVTGLSAGGQQSYGAVSMYDDVSKLIAAAVPMSPAYVSPYNPTLVGKYKIETWFFSGNTDGGYTVNATNYSNDCNTQLPGSSKLNIYSGGHCCWNSFYDVNWRDPGTNQSVWQWMLMQTRQQNQPLPVKFGAVQARSEKGKVHLSWEVAEEVEVAAYDVEKSMDGIRFSRIGSVPAAGKSLYRFTDAAQQARAFYRIKNVDLNGQFDYSKTVSVSGTITTALHAYPSPARESTLLQHPAASAAAQVHVYSNDGRLVKRMSPAEGSQQTSIDLSGLQKGYYILQYHDGNQHENLRIGKQ